MSIVNIFLITSAYRRGRHNLLHLSYAATYEVLLFLVVNPFIKPHFMKTRILILSLFTVLSGVVFAQDFSDDFESYYDGAWLPILDGFGQPGATSPALRKMPRSPPSRHSGTKSVKLVSTVTTGGLTDLVLPFGQKYTDGNFNYGMQMWIASGKGGLLQLPGHGNHRPDLGNGCIFHPGWYDTGRDRRYGSAHDELRSGDLVQSGVQDRSDQQRRGSVCGWQLHWQLFQYQQQHRLHRHLSIEQCRSVDLLCG